MKKYIKSFLNKENVAIRCDTYEDLHVFLNFMDACNKKTISIRKNVDYMPICIWNTYGFLQHSSVAYCESEMVPYVTFHPNDILEDDNLI